MSYRNYAPQNSHIVDQSGNGDFTTITAATTAAVSGQTIFINPGTFTENFTAKAGVNYTCASGDGYEPNVIINGNITCSSAGTYTFSNVRLQTNSANCLTVSGSAATVVVLENTYINCSNNTGISYTSSSGSSSITGNNCTFNLGTTGIAYYSMTSPGSISFYRCDLENSGGSSTVSSNSAGGVGFYGCVITAPISSTSTGFFLASNCYVAPGNNTAFTSAGSAGNYFVLNSFILSGTASAISIGSGTTLNVYQSVVNSSNTNAITGAGTLNYGLITFSGSSSTINTTTQVPISLSVPQGGTGISTTTAYGLIAGGTTATGAFQNTGAGTSGQFLKSNGAAALPSWVSASVTGTLVLLSTQTASSSATINFTSTITNTYNDYLLIFNNVYPATNGQSLSLAFSVNNGSTYIATNYQSGTNRLDYNSATITNANSTTDIRLSYGISSTTTNAAGNGFVWLYNMQNSGQPVVGGLYSGFTNTTSVMSNTTIQGWNTANTNINAIRLNFSSGNISTGTFSLYGLIQ